jgi:bifunctional DNase/RNase
MAHDSAIEMFVGGLVIDPATQAPIVVLKDESGDITLPIWIGIPEATSIASAIKQVAMARPLTHDLFFDLLLEVGVTVQRVVITELREATYFAELVLGQGDRVIVLDSRPSDAIAMALRASAPIYVAQAVLDQAKIAFGDSNPLPLPEPSSAEESATAPVEGSEAEGSASADESPDFAGIDKDKWEELLSQLDPEDFKYKT